MALSNSVASAVLGVYNALPQAGKPREDEYSVLAAVVAVEDESVRVLSLGTGTKCIGTELDNREGCYICDSHAEVIARRGFVRYLWSQVLASVEGTGDNLVQIVSTERGLLKLKDGVKLFMYVSDSPCGDAAVYDATLSGQARVVTGAQPVVIADCCVGCVRTKSGRNDIAKETRTTSMSCSDKLCRWSCLGLQGSVLAACLEPMVLHGIIVDPDPCAVGNGQEVALKRALVDRLAHSEGKSSIDMVPGSSTASSSPVSGDTIANVLPEVVVLERSYFPSGKAYMKNAVPSTEAVSSAASDTADASPAAEPGGKRRRRNPLSPCGFSINWILGEDIKALHAMSTHTNSTGTKEEACIGNEKIRYGEEGLGDDAEQRHSASAQEGKSQSSGRQILPKEPKRRPLPTVAGGTVEVTIAHTGALQGSTKQTLGQPGTASRLSRYHMRRLLEHTVALCVERRHTSETAVRMLEALAPAHDPSGDGLGDTEIFLSMVQNASRRELKEKCGQRYYGERRNAFLAHNIFRDWLCDDD